MEKSFDDDPEFRYFWAELTRDNGLGPPPNWLVEAGSFADQRAAAHREMLFEKEVVAKLRGKAKLSLADVVDEEVKYRPLIKASFYSPLFLSYLRRDYKKFVDLHRRRLVAPKYTPGEVRKWFKLPLDQQRRKLREAFEELDYPIAAARYWTEFLDTDNPADFIKPLINFLQSPSSPVEVAHHFYITELGAAFFRHEPEIDIAKRYCDQMSLLVVPVWERVVRVDVELAKRPRFLEWMERVWPRDAATGLPAARPHGNPDVAGFVRENWRLWSSDKNAPRAARSEAPVLTLTSTFNPNDRSRMALSRFWGVSARLGEIGYISGAATVRCLLHPARGYRATIWTQLRDSERCAPCNDAMRCRAAADIMRDVDAGEYGLVLGQYTVAVRENNPFYEPHTDTISRVAQYYADDALPENVKWFSEIFGSGLKSAESASGNMLYVGTEMLPRKGVRNVMASIFRFREEKITVLPLAYVAARAFDVAFERHSIRTFPHAEFARAFGGPDGFPLLLEQLVAASVNMTYGGMRMLARTAGRGMRHSIVRNARFLARGVYREYFMQYHSDLLRIATAMHEGLQSNIPVAKDAYAPFMMVYVLSTFEALRRTHIADNAVLHFPCELWPAIGIEALMIRNYGMVGYTTLNRLPDHGNPCVYVPPLLNAYETETTVATRDAPTSRRPVSHRQQIGARVPPRVQPKRWPEFLHFWTELTREPNWLLSSGSAKDQLKAAYREMLREKAVVAEIRGKPALGLADVVDEERNYRPLIDPAMYSPLFLSWVRRHRAEDGAALARSRYEEELSRRLQKHGPVSGVATRNCDTMRLLYVPVWERIVRIDPDFAHHSDFLRWMERVWPLDESTGLPAARPMGNPDVTGFVRKNWLHWKNRMEDSIGPVFLDSPPRAQTATKRKREDGEM